MAGTRRSHYGQIPHVPDIHRRRHSQVFRDQLRGARMRQEVAILIAAGERLQASTRAVSVSPLVRKAASPTLRTGGLREDGGGLLVEQAEFAEEADLVPDVPAFGDSSIFGAQAAHALQADRFVCRRHAEAVATVVRGDGEASEGEIALFDDFFQIDVHVGEGRRSAWRKIAWIRRGPLRKRRGG